jgi:hypothetical protein
MLTASPVDPIKKLYHLGWAGFSQPDPMFFEMNMYSSTCPPSFNFLDRSYQQLVPFGPGRFS